MLSVPFSNFARAWDDLRPELTRAFDEFGASGWYILGQRVRDFEAELAAYWGSGHAVGVASGLDAIQIALRVLGCGPGEKVLTTPISAFATTLAVINCGATPVFGDSGECGLVDLDACEEALERDRAGVFVVDDCAQAIGAENRGSTFTEVAGITCRLFDTICYTEIEALSLRLAWTQPSLCRSNVSDPLSASAAIPLQAVTCSGLHHTPNSLCCG